jgi:uncharacterized membrane protein
MNTESLRSTASIGGHPLHAILVPFPIACFIGAFFTDLAYWRTADVLWSRFSIWLLTVGLIVAAFAVIAGLIDFVASPHIRTLKSAWFHMLGNIVVLILSVLNAFIHSRDGYTAVVPEGIILSGVVVVILLCTGWLGWGMVYRQRVGVSN